MSRSAPRIPLVPPAEWTPEMRDFFAIMEGPDAREKGSQFNVVLTLANQCRSVPFSALQCPSVPVRGIGVMGKEIAFDSFA